MSRPEKIHLSLSFQSNVLLYLCQGFPRKPWLTLRNDGIDRIQLSFPFNLGLKRNNIRQGREHEFFDLGQGLSDLWKWTQAFPQLRYRDGQGFSLRYYVQIAKSCRSHFRVLEKSSQASSIAQPPPDLRKINVSRWGYFQDARNVQEGRHPNWASIRFASDSLHRRCRYSKAQVHDIRLCTFVRTLRLC